MRCCWRLRKDPEVEGLAIAPGNAGTARLADQHDVDITSGDDVVALAREVRADLVVIGPEVPLVLGVADAVRAAGIVCFGPSKGAARIEGSKAFAKDVMAAAGVRTATSEIVDTPSAFGRRAGPVRSPGGRCGLGGQRRPPGRRQGRGGHARTAVSHARTPPDCSRPGTRCCWSPSSTARRCRCSAWSTARPWCLCCRRRISSVSATATAGPNTGGMGAYAPLPWLPDEMYRDVVSNIVEPVAAEMVRA